MHIQRMILSGPRQRQHKTILCVFKPISDGTVIQQNCPISLTMFCTINMFLTLNFTKFYTSCFISEPSFCEKNGVVLSYC